MINMNSRCRMLPGPPPGGGRGRWCGLPATVPVEFGCAHEHVGKGVVCLGHAKMLESAPAMLCTPCWREGHKCRVMGRRVSVPGQSDTGELPEGRDG